MLWYYDDVGNFVRNGNIKIDGNLSGTNNIAIQGTAYSNLENNVKIVQGVPQGGKFLTGSSGTQIGAIKIKLPKAKSNTMFKFRVRVFGHYQASVTPSNSEYVVKGYNFQDGFGSLATITNTLQVSVSKDSKSTYSPNFYFWIIAHFFLGIIFFICYIF